MSQLEKVRARLTRYGCISTVQAVNMHILRLGDIIYRLRRDGMKIKTTFPTGKKYANYLRVK